MAHWTKTFKAYERHFLIALVILLLVAFSVTGALTQCSGGGQGGPENGLGGSFSVVGSAERVEVSDAEMLKTVQRYDAYIDTVQLPTLDFITYLRRARTPRAHKSAWMHKLLAEAAERAGYRCGPGQLRRAVRASLTSNDRTSSLEITPETYERFITQIWQRPASEFEKVLCEVVKKDELLSALVDPARFELTYEQAFEQWKASRERVDLRYLAAEGRAFADDVRVEELSRRQLSKVEDVLRAVSDTAKRIKIVIGHLKDHKTAKGAWPESLAVLTAKEAQNQPWSLSEEKVNDAWGHALVYVAGEGEPNVTSPGPDGQLGTADDVTLAMSAQLEAHRALAKVAEALVRFRNAGDPKVWPATLEQLTKPAVRSGEAGPTLPSLTVVPKDGWDRELIYEGGAPEASPALSSAGPDGQPGTPDDIRAEVSVQRGRVGPGPALALFVPADLKDSWGRPLSTWLRSADLGMWETHSAGKDGEAGTADDLLSGNQGELERFYARGDVRTDFLQPMRRRFKALVMHVPLVSEETLRRLWADHVDLRPGPADEEMLFLRWQSGRGTSEAYEFNATDPRDPEKGHGVALAKRMGWSPQALLLVPPKALFEVPTAPPALPAPGAPAAPVPAPPAAPAAPGAEPVPAPAAAPGAPADPLRKEYDEQGWREILVRQEFLERVLNLHWKDVVASRQALKEWERKGQKVTPRPVELTVEDLLADDRLGKYQPGEAERARGHRFLEFYSTDKADKTEVYLTSAEIEALPEFGDPTLPIHLGNLKGQDAASVPIQLNTRLTKVLAQNLDVKTDRVPELLEVSDKVFERFLEHRALERAERELAAFQVDVQKRAGELKEGAAKPGEGDDAAWDAALAAWQESHPGVKLYDERTGLFIGSRVPAVARAPEGASAEAQAALKRRNFVRQSGYGLVRAGAAKQDSTDATPGTFGRSRLRDESRGPEATGSAYLVRVAARAYPQPAEFSPRAYAEHLAVHVFGERRDTPQGARGVPVAFRKGLMSEKLADYLEDLTRLQTLFDLRTNSNLDAPPGQR